MLKEKVLEALNQQLNEELYSYYLYLSMSAHFDRLTLKGISNWFAVQAQEEMFHSMKFYNYILERGGDIELKAIAAPPKSWKSSLEIFENVLKHECYISECINKLVDLAISERDHATNAFLQWYVNEQVEEEASADEALSKFKLVDGNPSGLFMVDAEMGTRVPSPAAIAGSMPGKIGASFAPGAGA